VDQFVASDRFAEIWETVNRESHAQLNAALTGESVAVQIESGEVTIRLPRSSTGSRNGWPTMDSG
jgi:hypothetical protein